MGDPFGLVVSWVVVPYLLGLAEALGDLQLEVREDGDGNSRPCLLCRVFLQARLPPRFLGCLTHVKATRRPRLLRAGPAPVCPARAMALVESE